MNQDDEVQNYMGAIINFSNKMYLEGSVVDKDDLVQAGFIGMLNGLKSFSEEKAKETGTKKTSYVIQCIRNAIIQEANKFFGATILPHNKRLKLNSFKRLINQGKSKEDIIKSLLITEKEYDDYNKLLQLKSIVQIDSASEDANSNLTYTDIRIEEIDDNLLRELAISEEDILILKLKFSGSTYKEIAEYYNVSREAMRKRIHKSLQKIRNDLKE